MCQQPKILAFDKINNGRASAPDSVASSAKQTRRDE